MNTGIQDAYNLAWKIWMVSRGAASKKILETYNQERLENAENLLKTTDRFFNLVASPEPVLAYLRMHVFPYIAGAAFSFDAVKKFVFPRVSQIGINYRNSALSRTDGAFSVLAGERMPYFETEGASIYEKLKEPKFHLLTFFDGQNKAEISSGNLPGYVDFHELPLYPRVAEIFGADETFSVLLRPDNYIGLISAGASFEAIDIYLKNLSAAA